MWAVLIILDIHQWQRNFPCRIYKHFTQEIFQNQLWSWEVKNPITSNTWPTYEVPSVKGPEESIPKPLQGKSATTTCSYYNPVNAGGTACCETWRKDTAWAQTLNQAFTSSPQERRGLSFFRKKNQDETGLIQLSMGFQRLWQSEDLSSNTVNARKRGPINISKLHHSYRTPKTNSQNIWYMGYSVTDQGDLHPLQLCKTCIQGHRLMKKQT